MRYFGGKARIARHIAKHLARHTFSSYWEPFCGMCSVMEHVSCPKRFASDAHKDLILLWKALKQGWVPPDSISEEEYLALKDSPPSPVRAFAGFGCSNSGKWFGGYARENTGRNFAANAKSSLLRKISNLHDVGFFLGSYDEFGTIPFQLVYCDPPYAQTTGFSLGAFDTNAFWEWVRQQSEKTVVVVSEYVAPEDFLPVWEKDVHTDMKKSDNTKHERTEKLFVYRESKHLHL